MSSIEIEIKNSVAYINLNRPDVLNSFNREMALLLQKHLSNFSFDETVRAIHITGNGRAFCAGQDLAEVTSNNSPLMRNIVKEHYNPIIQLIRNIEKPIVCAVNGVAAGAGANIALACDIVFAAESASFIQAFSKIGLIPDSGGTYFLPRLIGLQKATALMFLGDKINASEAQQLGMIYKACPNDELLQTSSKCAEQLAKMPTKAFGLTKRLLNASFNNTLQNQLDMEEALQAEAGQTHDYNEGVQAFLQKRPPVFTGN